MKVTFIDFDDSFSFNVVQELTLIGLDVEVIHWNDFEEMPKTSLLALGPGPGHPDDYQKLFPLIREWLENKKPLFGVCLGHQILWRLQNEDIVRSKEPLHGQKIKLLLTDPWREWLGVHNKDIYVQRYNSLSVMAQAGIRNPSFQNYVQNDEILISRSSHTLTYQFHPESIGTSFRKAFMTKVYSIIEK